MTTPSAVPANQPMDTEPVLTLLNQIKANKLDAAMLSAENRRRCVEVLWGEGCNVAEIAQILKCGERTIYRDRSEIRAAHALHVHPQFAAQVAGELIRQAEASAARLRRIAREPGASAMERSMAENFAFKIQIEMIDKLQSLGYLPRVPANVVAQVVGAARVEIATYDQLDERLVELERLEGEIGSNNPEGRAKRLVLQELVRRGRTAAEIDELIEKGKGN